MKPKNEIFKSIYYNPSNPGSFGGQNKLLAEAKKIRSDIKRNDVRDWLSGELVYTLHKPVIRKFKRNPIISEQPKWNMQADLVDVTSLAKLNNNYKYILTCVDVFSKKAYAQAIKDKSQTEVTEGMKKILNNCVPEELMTDRGLEFSNRSFRSLMKRYNINHYFTKNQEVKCANIERFNRTLKEKMFHYFTLKGKRRYIDVLQELIDSYNNSFHRSIKMTPNQVNDSNTKEVFKNLYGFNSKREYLMKMKSPKLTIDDSVRKNYKKNVHDRGYYPNWTDSIYKIYKSMPGLNQPYYVLKNESGEIDARRYYPNEIQIVKPNLYRIEKILKKRKFRGKEQFFVKWLNHGESQNSWIDSTDLTNING